MGICCCFLTFYNIKQLLPFIWITLFMNKLQSTFISVYWIFVYPHGNWLIEMHCELTCTCCIYDYFLHSAVDKAGVNPLLSSLCRRDGCLSSCRIKWSGLSCVMPSTWSTRLRCRVTEACLRRTWSSSLRRPSAAPATTLTTTATWLWHGHSLTGSVPASSSPLI